MGDVIALELSCSASWSKDGEAAGIFRGYIWVKKQSQQPHPHLVIWLLAVADSYSEQLDSLKIFHSSFSCVNAFPFSGFGERSLFDCNKSPLKGGEEEEE